MKPANRLVLNGHRVTFTWSRLLAPANDWPCTPLHTNDNKRSA